MLNYKVFVYYCIYFHYKCLHFKLKASKILIEPNDFHFNCRENLRFRRYMKHLLFFPAFQCQARVDPVVMACVVLS